MSNVNEFADWLNNRLYKAIPTYLFSGKDSVLKIPKGMYFIMFLIALWVGRGQWQG